MLMNQQPLEESSVEYDEMCPESPTEMLWMTWCKYGHNLSDDFLDGTLQE